MEVTAEIGYSAEFTFLRRGVRKVEPVMPHRAVRGEGDEGGVVVDEHGVGDGVAAQCRCYTRVISRSVRNLLKMIQFKYNDN